MLRLVLADLRRHVARTVLTATGVAMGVATIVALLSVTAGIERSAAGLIHLGGSELGMFQAGVGELTASTLPRSLVPRVRAEPGVRDAAPIAVATGELPSERSFLLFGVEPQGFVARRVVFLAGRPMAAAGEAALGDAAARQLHLGVGDRLPLASGAVRIVGVYHAGVPFEDQGAALRLADVQRLLHRPGDATTIAVQLAPGASASAVGRRLEHAFPGTVAISQPGQVARVDTNTLLIRRTALAFVALALVIGAIAVTNTMLMAVFERRGDFALMLAVGWPRRLVARLVLQEGVLLALAGALAGVALGIAGGELVVRAVGARSLVSPHVSAWTIGRALLVATATGVAGSLSPAWWVTRLRPAEALG
ncbi:MAG TPA: ABC transporter permease [Baekduia sp.]|nr:ABC transporter permease [Baekduia sp.]